MMEWTGQGFVRRLLLENKRNEAGRNLLLAELFLNQLDQAFGQGVFIGDGPRDWNRTEHGEMRIAVKDELEASRHLALAGIENGKDDSADDDIGKDDQGVRLPSQ